MAAPKRIRPRNRLHHIVMYFQIAPKVYCTHYVLPATSSGTIVMIFTLLIHSDFWGPLV